MRWFCHIILFLLPMISAGQNLVPNPSFEEYNFCTNNVQGVGWADGWFIPQAGYSPDYYNSCSTMPYMGVPENVSGIQSPVSGDAYIGLYAFSYGEPHVREGISCQLLNQLIDNEKYVFRAFFSLADNVLYSIRTLGYKLSDQPVNAVSFTDNPPSFFNQVVSLSDKENWVLVTDTFIASGIEQYLTIGNFMIDSMSDTIYVGNGLNPFYDRAYYYVDDVSVARLDPRLSIEHSEKFTFSIYPNPATSNITIQSKTPLAQLWVSDMAGRPSIHHPLVADGTQDDRVVIDLSGLPSGIYFVEAITEDGQRSVQKVVVE